MSRHIRTITWSVAASPPATDPPLDARRQLLRTFGRLAIVIELTMQRAAAFEKAEEHASFGARLAVLRARVEAGDTSPGLASALDDFARGFTAFIAVDLQCRRVGG